jgi:hypothetical protein
MHCIHDGYPMKQIPLNAVTDVEKQTEAHECQECEAVQIITPDLSGGKHVLLFANSLEAAGQYPTLFQTSLFI